jgi:hypothetical protein
VNRYTVAVCLALFMILAVFNRTTTLRAIGAERSVRVALVYTPGGGTEAQQVRAAYSETLLENGIPFDWLASTDLALFDGEALAESYAAIVFPDTINRRVSEDAAADLIAFASLGGSVAVVGDAGSRTQDGTYRPGSLFTEISGVDSLLYNSLRSKAFGRGYLHFANAASATRWSVPAGKIDDGDLASYGYGPLDYPYAKAAIVAGSVRVDADNGNTPLLTVRNIERGRVAYVALPLGYLRTHSDAFPMKMLVSFLTRSGKVPHLVAAPDGVGRLVVDIHIDSSNEFLGIPNLRRHGLLRHDVPMEFDVTAGPDLNFTGDKLGFDACGRGKPFLRTLMAYASRIGSHGGWAHNEFAANVESGHDTPAEVRRLIDRNDRCLQSVTGVPVRSFAAPVGVHPQPMMTHVLDDLGIIGYYYTGDTGSPVERPFYDGTLVSSKSWAFPIMPLGSLASVAEMRRAHISPQGVERWMDGTANYAANQRGIYLLYTHSYDLLYPGYSAAMGRFLNHAAALARAGKLRTTNMVSAAEFMNRFVTTTASFTRSADGVHVRLYNPHGLREIAFAVPTAWIRAGALPAELHDQGVQGDDTILSVTNNDNTLDVILPGVPAS